MAGSMMRTYLGSSWGRWLIASPLFLFLILAGGCSNPVDKAVHKAKEISSLGENHGVAPAPDQEGVSQAFSWIAKVGALLVIAGMLSIVASAIPVIPIQLNPRGSWMLIITGVCGLLTGFAIPRLSFIFEAHLSEYLIWYVVLTLWVGSLFVVRKVTWKTAYKIGGSDERES